MIFCWILGWLLDHFWLQNSMKKKRLIFWLFFGWILDHFWDVFWEPNRIKKSMEFRTPFLINFCWFLDNFLMDFEVRKVAAEMFIFELFQPCPYGVNPGLKFSVRSQSGVHILGYFWLFWCPWAIQMELKSLQNLFKIWSFFGLIFGCDFVAK